MGELPLGFVAYLLIQVFTRVGQILAISVLLLLLYKFIWEIKSDEEHPFNDYEKAGIIGCAMFGAMVAFAWIAMTFVKVMGWPLQQPPDAVVTILILVTIVLSFGSIIANTIFLQGWHKSNFFLWKLRNKERISALPQTYNPLYLAVDFQNALNAPEKLKNLLVTSYGLWQLKNLPPTQDNLRQVWDQTPEAEREKILEHRTTPTETGKNVTRLLELVPAKGLVGRGETPIMDYILPTLERASEDDTAHSYFINFLMLGDHQDWFRDLKIGHEMPEGMRVEHMQVVASPGHGKTTLFTEMIIKDLESESAIILIDSQNDLILELSKRIPLDRLILIDPASYAPPLNIFAQGATGESGITSALDLFEYIFSGLGVEMTGRQRMVYRYLSRLCMTIPGGSVRTLRKLLQPGGVDEYDEYVQALSENERAFFNQYRQERNNEFSLTRQDILIRLLAVMENPVFEAMLGADRMAVDIRKAIDEGKVILVSTDKKRLGGGAKLLGRIFVGLVMQSVRSREMGARKRVYLYIDEFADYAEDSDFMLDCFSQGRKYELGMIVAHQNLSQLPEKLKAQMSSSTAIKFAGGVSAEDLRTLASQMRTITHEIDRQPKGTFLAYFKDIGTLKWPVKFGFIQSKPELHSIEEVHERMKELFGLREERASPSETDVWPAPPQSDENSPEDRF